jgi:DNA (cytosine-5)-methyltransferase 1
MNRSPTLIDLFAGAGGLTRGFVESGFEPVLAVELDKAASQTYDANFPGHVDNKPIQRIRAFPEADVIVGGPPCQGFSPLGRDRDAESRTQLNDLWRHFKRAVKEVLPQVFVVENVPQFLKSDQYGAFLRVFRREPLLREYHIEAQILNAAHFGVPQFRRRGIIIGSRVGAPKWPDETHGNEIGLLPYETVRDWIGNLPRTPQPETDPLHFGRNPQAKSIERYKAIPEGGNRFDLARERPDLLPECWRRKPSGTTDVFGRLWWDRPAFTIRTEFFKPEKGRYLHPSEDRPITHREAARLQTFPDDFRFCGSRIEIARQIGNAVPPKLAHMIAEAVKLLLVS